MNDSPPPEQTEEKVFQDFILVLKSGSVEKIDEILEKHGREIANKLESQQRQPPLYFAINLPSDEVCCSVIEKLLASGANPNFRDHNEQTIMFYACRDGKIQCVELLLRHGVSLADVDTYGQIPLFYIASENQLHLLDKYTDVEHYNLADKIAGQTPLYYAARKGHLEMCKELIGRGCSVTHHDIHNKTAVEYARRARYHEVTEFLSGEIKKIKDAQRLEQKLEQQQAKEHQVEESHQEKKKKKEKETTPHKPEPFNAVRNTYKLVFMDPKGDLHNVSERDAWKIFEGKPIEGYIRNVETIPKEALRADHDSWKKAALKIVTMCWKCKGGYWFHEPVDAVKFGIMDYYDIISYPMDLSTIKRKLTYNGYNSPESFAEEMRLIWQNCYKYNGEEHEISNCARELEKIFEENYETQLKNTDILEGEDE